MSVNGVELMGQGNDMYGDTVHSTFDEDPRHFDPTQAPENTLFCVPACWVDGGTWLKVLLIRLVDAERGTYCRLGVAQTNDVEWINAILARPDPPIDVSCVREEDDMHVIRLI